MDLPYDVSDEIWLMILDCLDTRALEGIRLLHRKFAGMDRAYLFDSIKVFLPQQYTFKEAFQEVLGGKGVHLLDKQAKAALMESKKDTFSVEALTGLTKKLDIHIGHRPYRPKDQGINIFPSSRLFDHGRGSRQHVADTRTEWHRFFEGLETLSAKCSWPPLPAFYGHSFCEYQDLAYDMSRPMAS